MSSSFISKLKYKKERVGIVEKDGKTYVKYVKARRFSISRNVKYVLICFFILSIFAVGIKILLSELSSREPSLEVAEGTGS